MDFINFLNSLLKTSSRTIKRGEINNWDEAINSISAPKYFHSSLYKGIKNLNLKLNDTIDYSDCITGWSTDINDCLSSINWMSPTILVINGEHCGLKIDNYAVLAPLKLKVVKVDGQYYFCKLYREDNVVKRKVKIIIDDSDELSDLRTYRIKDTTVNTARAKFLDRLEKK